MPLMSLRQAAKTTGVRYSALLYYHRNNRLETQKIGKAAVVEANTLREKLKALGYQPKEEKAK